MISLKLRSTRQAPLSCYQSRLSSLHPLISQGQGILSNSPNDLLVASPHPYITQTHTHTHTHSLSLSHTDTHTHTGLNAKEIFVFPFPLSIERVETHSIATPLSQENVTYLDSFISITPLFWFQEMPSNI